MADTTNQDNADQQATQEALQAYAPPPGYIHPGTCQTTWTPELWANLCMRYASGESPLTIAKDYHLPMSLIWSWASMPVLCEQWAIARKANSHSMIAIAQESLVALKTGSWADSVTNPSKGELAARAKGLMDSVNLTMQMAGKINPDEYGDRLNIDKRQVSAVYVVSYRSDDTIGAIPAHGEALAIPAPDSMGVERSSLRKPDRRLIAKERRLKLKQLASSDT